MSVAWVPSVLVAGDTLASLASLYRVDAVDLAERNGVVPSPGRRRDCAWGRRVDAWVLARSPDVPSSPAGFRRPYDPSSPWACSPGDGFASFSAGQVVRLPAGGPRPPASAPTTTKPAAKTSRAGWVVAGLASAVVVGVVVAVATSGDT